jgi:hypothetical protein
MASRRPPLLLALLLASIGSATAEAQSTLSGVVRDSASGSGLAEAEVLIPGLRLRARTDAQGRYRFDEIDAGRFPVIARKLGYDSVSVVLAFSGADSLRHDFDLPMRAQPLAEVPVRGKSEPIGDAKLRAFERRKAFGIGHFLSQDDLLKESNRRTSDVIQKTPGFSIVRGNGLAAYVGTSRGAQSVLGTARICVPGKGCANVCPAAVILDGITVYRGESGEPPFDVNSLQVSEIAAIEMYAGQAQMPAEFNATRRTCGALVIWTR